MRRILLYKTGETAGEIVREVGDYLAWFTRVLAGRAELALHVAFERPEPDPQARFDGVIVTGSPCSLVSPEPWMDGAAEFVRATAERGVPVLGVCFGHQLIGRAYGGAVRVNPNGWEAGSHGVELTDEGRRDPLFAGVPERLVVNQSHRDEVGSLGAGVVQLARGEATANQAIAVGDHVRGVQFHPEMNGVVIRRLLQHRHRILTDDALCRGRDERFHPSSLLERSGDTPDAERVVTNFLDRFVARA